MLLYDICKDNVSFIYIKGLCEFVRRFIFFFNKFKFYRYTLFVTPKFKNYKQCFYMKTIVFKQPSQPHEGFVGWIT